MCAHAHTNTLYLDLTLAAYRVPKSIMEDSKQQESVEVGRAAMPSHPKSNVKSPGMCKISRAHIKERPDAEETSFFSGLF